MHDAILVGIGTALNDDPQLNTRHLPPLSDDGTRKYNLPRPIVLDTHLRLRLDCKLLANYKAGTGRRPWIIGAVPLSGQDGTDATAWMERRGALENAGARVIEVDSDSTGISVLSLLTMLRTLGVRSLMVEGGARVIKSFLTSTQHRNNMTSSERKSRTVDAIIVTVAPTFVGQEGVGYGENLLGSKMPPMRHTFTKLFGRDTVIAFTTSP